MCARVRLRIRDGQNEAVCVSPSRQLQAVLSFSAGKKLGLKRANMCIGAKGTLAVAFENSKREGRLDLFEFTGDVDA